MTSFDVTAKRTFEPAGTLGGSKVKKNCPLETLTSARPESPPLANGEPVIASAVGECLLFDPTVPAVREYFHDAFSAMAQAGFELFKIDYIYRQYVDAAKRFHDTSLGKAAVIRKLLQTIRDAVGDGAHIISCGAPTESALGIADSARVSGDIHNFWGHVKACTAQVASCYWMHNRLWVNDPDFAIIRSPQTSDDPFLNRPYRKHPLVDDAAYWMAGDDASYTELRTWLTVVYLTGGSIFLSDCMPRLGELGLLLQTEAHEHNVGECYRCKATVEPLISTQWFVRMAELAAPAVDAARGNHAEQQAEGREQVDERPGELQLGVDRQTASIAMTAIHPYDTVDHPAEPLYDPRGERLRG